MSPAQSPPGPEQSDWHFQYRFQVLTETDNNVREELHNPVAAQSMRFMLHPKIIHRNKRLSFSAGNQSGLQLYGAEISENKLIDDFKGKICYDITPWFKAGLQGFARFKLFLNKETDYALNRLNPFFQIALPAGFMLQTGYGDESLSYASTSFYNYNSSLLYLSVAKMVLPGLCVTPVFQTGSIDLNRQAYEIVPGLLNWQQKQDLQRDQLSCARIQLDWMYRGLLFNISYAYESVTSNSYGFGYRRHVLNLLFARNFFGLLVRGYGTIQSKMYRDEMLPIWPLYLDTEKEESNFLVMDFSYEVTRVSAIMLRCAYYKNESPWADLYYEKWLVNAGIEFNFSHE